VQSAKCFLFTAREFIPAFLILFISCARQMPPPGGPPDEIAPWVMGTIPVDDSVHVALDSSLRIRFSEGMDRRSVERALFISPQPITDPVFKWRGSELEIRLPDGLQADRTYVVTVGRESSDEWRNRMRASYSFGFATGDKLNRGELTGRVLPSKAGQMFVWAFDLGVIETPDPGYDRPAYVTQPDEAGYFLLPRLGPGRYRVFAFEDTDGNRTYTAGEDPLAVPPADIVLASEADRIRLGDLKLAVRDTSGPQLVTVRTPDEKHVLMRFDESVRVLSLQVDDLVVHGVYQDPMDSSRVGVVTEAQTGGTTYRIEVDVMDGQGNRDTLDTTVRGDATRDRRAPEVLMVEPDGKQIIPYGVLTLVFSDAMRPDVLTDFWLASDSTFVPLGKFDWPAPNRLVFMPEGEWPGGETIRLQGAGDQLLDVAGNTVSDSISFVFSVLDTAELGTLHGVVETTPAVVWVEGMDNERIYAQVLQDSTFVLSNLIPGLYRISGFWDLDGNGRWMSGMVDPFMPSEPLVAHADTQEVRARWEMETQKLKAEAWWMLTLPEEEP